MLISTQQRTEYFSEPLRLARAPTDALRAVRGTLPKVLSILASLFRGGGLQQQQVSQHPTPLPHLGTHRAETLVPTASTTTGLEAARTTTAPCPLPTTAAGRCVTNSLKSLGTEVNRSTRTALASFLPVQPRLTLLLKVQPGPFQVLKRRLATWKPVGCGTELAQLRRLEHSLVQ